VGGGVFIALFEKQCIYFMVHFKNIIIEMLKNEKRAENEKRTEKCIIQ
jgi:hypothetical protein